MMRSGRISSTMFGWDGETEVRIGVRGIVAMSTSAGIFASQRE